MTKVCKTCQVEQDIKCFARTGWKDTRRGTCKTCRNLEEKLKDKSHRLSVTYEYKREERLKRLYGITLRDYNTLLIAQNYECAICKKAKNWKRNDGLLVVDHDHKTGKVRGLLCHYCNSLLGHARDDCATLLSAVQYLEVRQDEELSNN